MTLLPKSWMFTKVLFGILLTVCVAIAAPLKIIDTELAPYYDRYMFLLEQYCTQQQYFVPTKITMTIEEIKEKSEDGDTLVAECFYDGTKIVRIIYDKKFYDKATETERMSTISHELRHCLFHIPNEGHSKKPINYFNQYDNGKKINLYDLYQQLIDDFKDSCEAKHE